jgi:hypothetical protein
MSITISEHQAEKIAEHMINIIDNLYMSSIATLGCTLQPFVEGTLVFCDNKYMKDFATSDDLRSTDIGAIIFNYASSTRTPELHANAVSELIKLFLHS